MEVIDMSGQDGVTSDMTTLEQIIELTTQSQPLPLEELTITHCQVQITLGEFSIQSH